MATSFQQQFDTPVSREQRVEYIVRMERPDRKRVVVRRLFSNSLIQAVSLLQLGGFLTHRLFADSERGTGGTIYHITVKGLDMQQGFTLQRDHFGKYRLT